SPPFGHFLSRGSAGMDMTLEEAIRKFARPVRNTEDLDPLLEAVGDAKIVLLGESTHGTSEFYWWRAEITQRLIKEKGFSLIAVERDWPSVHAVHRWLNHYDENYENAHSLLQQSFTSWPRWMWANEEITELIDWLKD